MHLIEIRKEYRFNTELLELIEMLKSIAAAQYHTCALDRAGAGLTPGAAGRMTER